MADDLATINLQKIDDILATQGPASEGLDKAITEEVDKARAAQAAGDNKSAIAITSKILERLEKTSSGA
ncbi:hypothetical protein [Streptomyces sp. NPDC057695]|uniref:hypothetical protein n=1 Tax=unclassified Streptomyces TaxID=2593676 RepID=UPI0036327946